MTCPKDDDYEICDDCGRRERLASDGGSADDWKAFSRGLADDFLDFCPRCRGRNKRYLDCLRSMG